MINKRDLFLKIGSLIGSFIRLKRDYLVLEYHDVNSKSKDPFAISKGLFIKHLKTIEKSKYNVISLDELVDLIKNGEDTRNCLIFTFDDGFKSYLYDVLPLLEKFNFPATFFVNINPTYNKEYGRQFLTLDEIKELSKSKLVIIGNHTYSHKSLKNLNKKEIKDEITKAHELIKNSLGIKMKHFCPPGGGFNNSVWEVCKELGYKSISIGTPKFNYKAYKNPYIIERIAVHYLNEKHLNDLLNDKLNFLYWVYKKI
jgi:peptidoglycan/xylan/chitin deacetylase (PgdA/CDA1 family)